MNARCVVVTGASAGIGRATALAFARKGYRVGLLARGEDGLAGARRDVEAAGGQALAIVTDVAEHAQVEAAAERIEQELGPIDVWVNNAMTTIFAPLAEVSPEDFERVTRVTYLGSVWGTMAALKRMKPRNAGTIVQVGSALAYRSIPLQAAYCGAKSALRGFTDSLRSELIHDGSKIHLTMVHLAAFNTPQFEWGKTSFDRRPQPVPPIFQPEIAADAVVWSAQHRRRELWVGFPTFKAIVGNRFIPGILDHWLARQAWSGQITGESLPQHRKDNLYQPVEGDHGAHGRFDAQSKPVSWQYRLSKHRWAATAASVALLATAGAVLRASGKARSGRPYDLG
jgi:NAD(P)-dependent dehydrogenase (short-subunit alcohol dehydrogenase family)